MEPTRQEQASPPATRYVWFIALLFGSGWLLYRIRGTFPIFLLGFLLAYAANPLLHRFESRGLRRGQAVQLVFLILVAVLLFFVLVLAPLVLGQIEDFRQAYQSSYRATVLEWTRNWEERISGITPARLKPLLFEAAPDTMAAGVPGAPDAVSPDSVVTPGVSAAPGAAVSPGVAAAPGIRLRPYITTRLAHLRDGVVPRVVRAVAGWMQRSIGALVLLFILPVITFYFMREFDPLRRRVIYLVPAAHRARVLDIARDVNQTLSVYVRGQMLVGALFSLATLLVLGVLGTVLGMRFWLLLGILAGPLYLIPWAGMAINVTLGGLVGLLTGTNHVLTAVLAMSTYIVLNFVFDNLVVPRMMGRQLGLHPLVIIFALLAGAEFGGVLGMIVAVPVAGALKAALTHVYPQLHEPVPADVERLVPSPDLDPKRGARRPRFRRR